MRTSSATLIWASALLVGAVAGCDPNVVGGEWTCPAADAGAPFGRVVPNPSEHVRIGWSTGFEGDFCDFTRVHSFCYADDDASFSTVTSPVHSGKYAAAFAVTSNNSNGRQSRCVRQGVLPKAAYYSAWYFVPSPATNNGNWNLFHFTGGDSSPQKPLWDVSISSASNGDLSLYVLDFLGSGISGRGETPKIPIGSWFEVGVFLRRAADATGEFALYQNGQRIFERTNVITDDTQWGQWYVGNLADNLSPATSTLYVDDMSVREAP